MISEPCLVYTKPSWLDDYPGQVRWHIDEIERESSVAYKYHRSKCEVCGIEVLIAVRDPYLETSDGRIAVMLNGKYTIISDEVVDEEEHS